MTAQPPKRATLNFETVGSITAMVIGASALFVAWDQAQVMRAQQHASVWPILDAEFYISGDENSRFIEFVLANAGVGPALIESAALKVNGVSVARWRDVADSLFETAPPGPMSFNGESIEGSVIAPGGKVSLLKASWPSSDAADEAFKALAGKYLTGAAPEVYVEACYCSVFERCWRTLPSGRSEAVKACPAPTNFFETLFVEDDAAGAGQ